MLNSETYRVVGFEVETQSIQYDKIKSDAAGSCTKNLIKGESNEQLINPKSNFNFNSSLLTSATADVFHFTIHLKSKRVTSLKLSKNIL